MHFIQFAHYNGNSQRTIFIKSFRIPLGYVTNIVLHIKYWPAATIIGGKSFDIRLYICNNLF